MGDRPYTVLSCVMSIDGFLDDAAAERLVLSSDADLDRVDAVRASCDAILVGAGTVRADDPRLLVRGAARIAARVAGGLTPTPTKVTVTGTGRLDPAARFFRCGTDGGPDKLVYCDSARVAEATSTLGGVATVCDGGRPLTMERVAMDLHERGVRRLMVEGGRQVLTQFLADGLADELQLAVAPFFVGDSRACRLVGDGDFPWTARRSARLAGVRPIGDLVVMRYALSDRVEEGGG
jgi:5-amino-6-(5-phosphoribosylamino)uracil reductase